MCVSRAFLCQSQEIKRAPAVLSLAGEQLCLRCHVYPGSISMSMSKYIFSITHNHVHVDVIVI